MNFKKLIMRTYNRWHHFHLQPCLGMQQNNGFRHTLIVFMNYHYEIPIINCRLTAPGLSDIVTTDKVENNWNYYSILTVRTAFLQSIFLTIYVHNKKNYTIYVKLLLSLFFLNFRFKKPCLRRRVQENYTWR